ncbi:hypothetical protein ACS0TY_003532 [Phlomoides rotata]
MAMELDLLEERCMSADMKNVVYRKRSEGYCNSQVKLQEFQAADLVLRKVFGAQPGLFGPTWEGPYR